MNEHRPPPGESDGPRFAPLARPDAELPDIDDTREVRLDQTLAEISVCLSDGEKLVLIGKQRFSEDWLVQRASRNIVTEFAETVSRLPDRFKQEHPEVPWRNIIGTRNRIVHVYTYDPEIVWKVLSVEFPAIRRHLNIH